MFYRADPVSLEAELRDYLAAAEPAALGFPLRILIVPHAGHVYSGPIAAAGYRLVAESAGLRRVVMLGPSHYVSFPGLALPGVASLATPLGRVAVDPGGVAALLEDPMVVASPDAHRREHCLEVQLPFLQVVAPGVPVVPLLTGAVDVDAAADLVASLLDDETLLLISSDLSHYHDTATARRRDAATAAAIVDLEPGRLDYESACGRTGIQIALSIAGERGYRARLLDLRNSADTAGSPDRVVGYGTFAFG
jgi:AmmeMemoRadiSam system protein B